MKMVNERWIVMCRWVKAKKGYKRKRKLRGLRLSVGGYRKTREYGGWESVRE